MFLPLYIEFEIIKYKVYHNIDHNIDKDYGLLC